MFKKFNIALVCISLMLFLACEKEIFQDAEVNTNIVKGKVNGISKVYHPLDDNTSNIQDFDENTGETTVVFSDDQNDSFKSEEIIVIDLDTIGYIRRIIGVEKLADNTYQLQTEPAYMGDVFVDAHFKLSSENLAVEDLNISARNSPSIINNAISKAFLDEEGYSHPVKAVFKKKGRRNHYL